MAARPARHGPTFGRVVDQAETGTTQTAGLATEETVTVPVNAPHTTAILVSPTARPLTAMSGDRITIGVTGTMASVAIAATGTGRTTAFLSAGPCRYPSTSRGRGLSGTRRLCRMWSS